MARHRKQARFTTRGYVVMALGILLGVLAFVAAWKLYRAPEDTAPVWICGVQGNRRCGPNCPPVSIYWGELIRPWRWL